MHQPPPIAAADRVTPVPPDGHRVVRRVERALDLLSLVADGPRDGLSLADLSRSSGLAKSSVLATARTLADRGFLRAADPGPSYRLGPALVRLGDLCARRQPLSEMGSLIVHEVARTTGLTTHLCLAEDGHPVFIERVDGSGTVRFHTPLGAGSAPPRGPV